MATTSFGRRFYVAPENVDEFIEVVTAPPKKDSGTKFESRQMTEADLRKYTEAVFRKNGRL